MKRCAWFAQIKPVLWLTIVTTSFFMAQITNTLDIIVTSENDSGAGTLRQAILDINAAGAGPHNITFATNVTTISLLSLLPRINNTVTVDGFNSEASCNAPSPVDNPKAFSASISVTIDGSNIPKTSSTPVTGFLICASANPVTLRGLRIAHFSNLEDTFVAGVAIEGANATIECCEITDLNGNLSTANTTVSGIYEINSGNQSATISKCFVHNLNTINRTASSSETTTGSIVGIAGVKYVCDSRIENLTSGSIMHTNELPGSSSTRLQNGSVVGIRARGEQELLCANKSKQCPTICQDKNCIHIDNCLVTCCRTGSITATKSAIVFASSAIGISLSGRNKAFVTETQISNILSGTILLSEGTFTVSGPLSAIGIFTQIESTTLQNNTIATVTRGAMSIGGINSSAIIPTIAGIFSESNNIIVENNTVCNIKSLPLSAFGICTTVRTSEADPISGPCAGDFANPINLRLPLCIGIFFNGNTITAHNNTIFNIDGGESIATDDRTLLVNGSTNGIFISSLSSEDFLAEVSVQENSINNVFGTRLVAKSLARGAFGGNGSKGVNILLFDLSNSGTATIRNNKVANIHEQILSAEASTTGEYIFPEIKNNNLKTLAKQSAKTAAISILKFKGFSNENLLIADNIISKITGATVHKDNSNTGTIAIGINVESRNFAPPGSTEIDASTCLLKPTNPPHISNNHISNIKGGTNNAAYGIMLDGTPNTLDALAESNNPLPSFLIIQNNKIEDIVGCGTPQPFEAPLFSLDDCGSDQEDNVAFFPFPYQPTSGIYTLFEHCTTITNNIISNIAEPNKNARGITTQASSDIEIQQNTISKVNGYGIFVGGASTSTSFIGSENLLTEEEFENLFSSNRNKIFSNSTFDTIKQGIKLGVVDWSDYFNISKIQCAGSNAPLFIDRSPFLESISIIGNHGQPAPRICAIKMNSNGTITASFIFSSPDQPLTRFIIQFFANKTNNPPHGKQHISSFNDPACVFKTNENGYAKKEVTFTPVALTNSTDTFSAHVTVATSGQNTTTPNNTKGDTSEFGLKIADNSCPLFINDNPSANNQKIGWLSFLGKN